jgi:hypothetical protein
MYWDARRLHREVSGCAVVDLGVGEKPKTFTLRTWGVRRRTKKDPPLRELKAQGWGTLHVRLKLIGALGT